MTTPEPKTGHDPGCDHARWDHVDAEHTDLVCACGFYRKSLPAEARQMIINTVGWDTALDQYEAARLEAQFKRE